MVLKILKRLLLGSPAVRIDHPVLGKALLMKTKAGAYWEADPRVEGKAFSLTIETRDAEPPSIAQVEFFQRFARAPDYAFAFARPLLVAEYEKWMREPFPSNWREAFEFVGITVPLDGDERQPWDIAFDCLRDRDGHMFSCYIEDGKPSYVTIDG
jgi:hypothetical protein